MTEAESKAALTPVRRGTLEAVVERILPAGRGPGGGETGAAGSFESAMHDPFYAGLRPGIEQVLDWLEGRAGELHACGFAACGAGEQDELLRTLEADPNPWMQFVFRVLIELTLEGFLGDPVHGGNRSFRGWEAVGLAAEDVRSGRCLRARAS